MALRVGVIGCGFISYAHISGWKNNNVDVVALCDINEERLNSRADEFSVKSRYKDYKEMVEKEQLDIVDIVTPVGAHRQIMDFCCSKVRNILIEKPFVNNIEDGKYLVKQCKKNGCRAMVCQSYRWHPWFEKIKEELDSGIIGKPIYANIMQRVSFDIPTGAEKRVPLIEDQPFYENVEMLMLLEQGCHFLDIYRHFFGEPQYVQAHVERVSPYVLGDDLAVVIIKFPDTVSIVEDLWCTNGQEKTSVTFIQGEKGSIYFDGTDGAAPHRTEETGDLIIELKDGTRLNRAMDAKDYYNRCFEKMQKHFLDCIEKNMEPLTSIEDNLKTLQIAFKAYRSSSEKKILFFGE